MAIGFDYGTANCSVAHIVNQKVEPIALNNEEFYISSTLSAPSAESVSEYLFRCLNIQPVDEIGRNVLSRALRINQQEDLDVHAQDIKFGQQALNEYLDDPKHVYYIKSPKSFLGTMGLRDAQLSFFEDIVCAMMSNIKRSAEQTLQQEILETVIGRPVNFQGRGGDASNKQAEGILRRAATRAGFKEIEFQFEPVAAGLEYEASLTEDKKVLVVDIGGGTTDCSFLHMGPSWFGKQQREQSLLGHTGQLVGGNDLDIFTAFKCFMQEFGSNSRKMNGLPAPITQFWNPIAINDVQAQRAFYTRENLKELNLLMKESQQPELIKRLIEMQQDSLGYALIKQAENTKIALGEQEEFTAQLELAKEVIQLPVSRQQMDDAIEPPTSKIKALVEEAVKLGETQPDVIYMTGGSARSPLLRATVQSVLPNVPLVAGNYFGSVTAGLARWAQVCFK